jgi:hypothetical protein
MTLSCEDDMLTFRQHSGECWNDSIQTFFMLGAGIGTQLREALGRAGAVSTFRAWIQSPQTESWLKKEFKSLHVPATMTLFQRLATEYIQCFKERLDNWNVQRKTKQLVLSRRRASCVFSMCSAAAGMYASELLWSHEESALIGRPELLTPELLAELQAGASPAKNAAMNRESARVQKGYALWSASRFLRILMYYFTKKDRFLPVQTLATTPIEALAKKTFMISDFSLDMQAMASIYQAMKRTHSINIFADGFNLLKGKDYRVGHQIHFLSCDTDTRDEYVYDDNQASLQQVKWSRVFEPGAKSYYLRWRDQPLDVRVVQRIFLMLFSAQAFVSAGKRTTEKMRENYRRLARQEEDPLLKTPMTYFANFLDTNDLTTREEDKKSFFDVVSVDISKDASNIREQLSEFIKTHYSSSPVVKIFASFKPILIVFHQDKYYFFNKTGFLVLADEQLQEDGLSIAALLFCEDDVEKYFYFLATAFHNCYAYYTINQSELMWLTPRKQPLLQVLPARNARSTLKQKSLTLGNFYKKRSLKKPKTI